MASEAGADGNIANHRGQMALLCVSQAACYQSIKLLVTLGANVNAVNNDGDTFLP